MLVVDQVLAALSTSVPVLTSALAWLVAHPVQAVVVDLGAALAADWLSGVAVAIVEGSFRLSALPRILKTQLASQEAIAIYGLIVSAAAGAIAAGQDVGQSILLAAASAAALYSLPLWRDSAVKVREAVGLLAAKALAKLGYAPKAPMAP